MSKLFKSKDGILFASETSRLKYELNKGLTVKCDACEGTGYIAERVVISIRGIEHWGLPRMEKCPQCDGSGYI